MSESTFVSPEETEAWMQQLKEEENRFPEEEDSPEVLEEQDLISAELLGLLYIGKLNKSFSFKGNNISIKTLTIGEELQASLLTREYEGSEDYLRAAATAIVAASIETVNGKPLVGSLGPSQDDLLRRKFEYVQSRWYWPTIKFVYVQYLELLQAQADALDELEKK